MALRPEITIHRLRDWAPDHQANTFVCGLARTSITADGQTYTRLGAARWNQVTCRDCLRAMQPLAPTAAAGRTRTHFVDVASGLQACSLVATEATRSTDLADVTCGACKRSIIRRLAAGPGQELSAGVRS